MICNRLGMCMGKKCPQCRLANLEAVAKAAKNYTALTRPTRAWALEAHELYEVQGLRTILDQALEKL